MILAASDCACELMPIFSNASFLMQVPEISLAVAVRLSVNKVPACKRVLASDIIQDVNLALFESETVPVEELPVNADKSAHPAVKTKIEINNAFFMVYSFLMVNDLSSYEEYFKI